MRRSLFTSVIAFAAITALTSCGTSQNYSGSKTVGVYATIPSGWHKISQNELHAREMQSTDGETLRRASSVVFQEAYSLSPEMKAADVFSLKTPKSPIVFLRSRDLNGEEMNAVSYNWLRDVLFPLTKWLDEANHTTPKYQLLDDLENVQKGARGVETLYNVEDSDHVLQTISQTSLVSNDRSRIYVLIIRAKSDWFTNNSKVLRKIQRSFTVRSMG